MNLEKYLSRIGVDPNEVRHDIQTLRLLQRQHLLNVPFENLDIHWKRPIVLDTDRFFEKIVENNRGGFCYELNGLFNELLREIGFQTRLISARVFGAGGGFGPEFDHAAIIVTIERDEYLADVGFGDFTFEPLRVVADLENQDREGIFQLIEVDYRVYEVVKKTGDVWKPEYSFETRSRELTQFAAMCDFQQYSPDSHFTKRKICSQMTIEGRKTLTDTKFIVTSNGEKTETEVASDAEFDAILLREFGIRRDK